MTIVLVPVTVLYRLLKGVTFWEGTAWLQMLLQASHIQRTADNIIACSEHILLMHACPPTPRGPHQPPVGLDSPSRYCLLTP